MIVNWLITRRCNRRCSYCGIVHDPQNPALKRIMDINDNEMTFEDIKRSIIGMNKVYDHRKLFHIFYGGEPFLKRGFSEFLKWINSTPSMYTVITNGSMQNEILRTFSEAGKYKGLTVSLDPMIMENTNNLNEVKNNNALDVLRLNKSFGLTNDMVVECVFDKNNLKYAIPFLDMMSIEFPEVTVSISAYDYPKNDNYDFALNPTTTQEYIDSMRLKPLNFDVNETFKKIIDGIQHKKYNIHLGHDTDFINKIQSTIDSTYMCEISYKTVENEPVEFKTLTVDADGEFRLCLRISGDCKRKVWEVYGEDDTRKINENTRLLEKDFFSSYNKQCSGCAWTCPMMDEHWSSLSDVAHNQDSSNT